jgi:hypothetical protein
MLQHVNATLDQFLALVRMNCPDGLDLVKKNVIRQAIRDFLKSTRAWHEDIDDIRITPADEGVLDVANLARLIAPETIVLDIHDIRLSADETPLTKTHREIMDKNISDWRAETTDSEPTHFWLTDQGELFLWPPLESGSDAVQVDIELVLMPTMAATKFPDFLYNKHDEAIVAAVCQKLCSQKGSPWYDPAQAKYFLAVYKDKLLQAKNARAKKIIDSLNARKRRSFR